MDVVTAKNAAKVFYIHVWRNHGFFKFIIFDWGRLLVNHFWEQLITRLKILATFSPIYDPGTDGQTEIMDFVFEQYLKAYVNYFQNDWAFWLPSSEFIVNNHVSETTQRTPFLKNSKRHFKMGLEPDPFIIKQWIYVKCQIKILLIFSFKKWRKLMKFSKNK